MTTINPTSSPSWRWFTALLAVSLLALGMRWYYVSVAMVVDPVRGDATQYYAYALNLLHHGVFSQSAGGAGIPVPDNYRDPGYPFFLALWMKLLGTGETWYAAVLLCQALLGALTVTLATQLGKYWLSTGWSIGAGVLMAIWPHSITINSYLLSESLFSFLCVFGLLLCMHAFKRHSSWGVVAGGVVLGAAALTNAIMLPFGLLLAGVLAWRKMVQPRLCLVLAVSAMLLPCVWGVRNTRVVPPSADNSSLGRALQNLEQGSWPEFQTAWRESILGTAATKASSRVLLQTVESEYHLLRTAPVQGAKALLHRFAEQPARYASWYLFEKPYLLWGWGVQIGQGDIYVYPTAKSPFQTQPSWIALAAICHALNLPILLLALASVFTVFPSRQPISKLSEKTSRAASASVFCLLGFVTLVYTTLQAEPRYSIPFRALEMLLAATTLYHLSMVWQMHKRDQATRQTLNSER